MTSGPLILYYLGLILLPLAALALTRFRLVPTLLFLAVLHHHPLEPMPGDHEMPPICCALAQSVEADPEELVAAAVLAVRLGPTHLPPVRHGTYAARPAIRAPPPSAAVLTPAPWAPDSWAA